MTDATKILLNLVKTDPRYKLDAYIFVRDGLSYAQEILIDEVQGDEEVSDVAAEEGETEPDRHLSGQQLCQALRLYAIDQFGYMAKTVLNSWGLQSTSDFGEVVYNMIEKELMKKSKTDRREDFDNVFDFEEALQQQFNISSAD